jgi:hypothetical protein
VTNYSYVNAETVCELLRNVAGLGLGVPVTLVMDNARYQRCRLVQDLAAQLNIELLFLPSYSPNLNLIERLWKFTKKEVCGHGGIMPMQTESAISLAHVPRLVLVRSRADLVEIR